MANSRVAIQFRKGKKRGRREEKGRTVKGKREGRNRRAKRQTQKDSGHCGIKIIYFAFFFFFLAYASGFACLASLASRTLVSCIGQTGLN